MPGGKIEPGESPYQAASRELREETNLLCYACEFMGQISGEFGQVHVIKCMTPVHAEARQMEEQPIYTLWLDEALNHPKLIPNLKLVIPLCLANIKMWDICDTRGVMNYAGMGLQHKVLFG